VIQAPPIIERADPCHPSPCGANAVCRESNGAGSCSCLPEYFGNPYDACKPECVLNSDCPSNKACVTNKCKDPCPGVCAYNAFCQVINHLPVCTCPDRFTGNAFVSCNPIPVNGIYIFNYNLLCINLMLSLQLLDINFRSATATPV
jgi:hypothetical protein